jgi:hypothetical protein
MADSTLTTWTCDRCGTRTSTDPHRQPDDWSAVRMTTPPKRVEDPYLSKDLCDPCACALLEFLGDPESSRGNVASWERTLRRDNKTLRVERDHYKKILDDILAAGKAKKPGDKVES